MSKEDEILLLRKENAALRSAYTELRKEVMQLKEIVGQIINRSSKKPTKRIIQIFIIFLLSIIAVGFILFIVDYKTAMRSRTTTGNSVLLDTVKLSNGSTVIMREEK